MDIIEQVAIVKGGVSWFELSMNRGKKGLELYVKTDPRVEDFMKSLGNGGKDGLEAYGRDWFPLEKDMLHVYKIERSVDSKTYTLSLPAEPLRSLRDGKINLSFLRIVGIGDPQGIKFGVTVPISRSAAIDFSKIIITEVRNVIRDYIVPFNINLRISSQEI